MRSFNVNFHWNFFNYLFLLYNFNLKYFFSKLFGNYHFISVLDQLDVMNLGYLNLNWNIFLDIHNFFLFNHMIHYLFNFSNFWLFYNIWNHNVNFSYLLFRFIDVIRFFNNLFDLDILFLSFHLDKFILKFNFDVFNNNFL